MDITCQIAQSISLLLLCPCEKCNAEIESLKEKFNYYESLDHKVKAMETAELFCDKCKDEDHEGYFCRCEDRNINLSKRLRETDNSPWKKDENRNGNVT